MDKPTELITFDTDDPEFTRGFECGELWAGLQRRPVEYLTQMHSSNYEMAKRIAKYYGYALEPISDDETWLDAVFHRLLSVEDREKFLLSNSGAVDEQISLHRTDASQLSQRPKTLQMERRVP